MVRPCSPARASIGALAKAQPVRDRRAPGGGDVREARRPSSASAGAVSLAPQRASRPRATSRFSVPSGRRCARPCRLGSGRDLLGSQRVRHRVIYCGCCHRPAAGGGQPVGAGGALRGGPGIGSGSGAWLPNESHRRQRRKRHGRSAAGLADDRHWAGSVVHPPDAAVPRCIRGGDRGEVLTRPARRAEFARNADYALLVDEEFAAAGTAQINRLCAGGLLQCLSVQDSRATPAGATRPRYSPTGGDHRRRGRQLRQ
jgi:hypothetical protein